MTTYNKARFEAANPTKLFNLSGVQFFEHPTRGDEEPAIGLYKGRYLSTEFWDLPAAWEVDEWKQEIDTDDECFDEMMADIGKQIVGQ